MAGRRLVAAAIVVATVVTGSAALGAGPVSVSPSSVQVSKGSVTITRTSVSNGQELDYSVAFVGPLKVHGWSHNGRLSGTSTASYSEAFSGEIPNFSVASGDGRVTGQCGGAPNNPVDDTTGEGVSDLANRHGFVFDCVLADGGSTPWQVRIDALTQAKTSGAATTTFSGTYAVTDVETSLVGLDADVTYGDAQLTEYTDSGGGVQWGPLRLSGQVVVGAARYRGDLVSAVGPYGYGPTIPDMTVSGSANGSTVSGDCAGVFDDVLSQAVWTMDFTCNLSVNGGAPATVQLRTTFPTGGGRCVDRQCWTDYAGYFTNQQP